MYDIIEGKMSTSPYSEDLRKKVIKYIEKGGSKKGASEVFELHRNTVSLWWNRYKKEGDYRARERLGKKSNITAEEVKEYVELNHNFKASDMGKRFGISSVGAFYWLKKLGYSYKKKPIAMWKLTRRSEKSI